MVLAGLLIAGIAAAWLGCAVWIRYRQRISMRQAVLHAPLALLWRIDARALRTAGDTAPVIYVVSHQSRLDPALMLGLLPDDTLHILDDWSAVTPWLEPWRALARTIAFNPEHLFISRRLVRVLRGGGKLCVYMPPEIEPDQRAFRLYRAVARVAARAGAAIIPIYVSGADRLPFSLAEGGPRRLFPRLKVHALEPVTIEELMKRAAPAPSTRSNALFDRLAEVRFTADCHDGTLFTALARSARLHGSSRTILDDASGQSWSYRRLLTAVRLLGERFAGVSNPGEAIGLLLPNAAPAVAAYFALHSAGRVAAMLNHTAGAANLKLAIRTADLRIVVSSRAFVEAAQLADTIAAIEAEGARLLWLEDVGNAGMVEKLIATLTRFRPVSNAQAGDAAVMLFTSGSEGAPKGVLLSHGNILANVTQVASRLAFHPADAMFNVLPVFHAFGMTAGMVLPLACGMRLHLYPTPLHYRQIPEAVAKARATILLGTDTFLAAYARSAKDGDFSSLRLAVAGAEPVRAETRRVWRERFSVAIAEGYGMTEASPVVAVNSATHNRDGTVGRLLPGIRAMVEPVEGIAEGGRLAIAGPNIMKGYRTAEHPGETFAPPGGWHESGDIVGFDKEGFVVIRGRAKRFAKIAGEMVSLGAVEMLAQSLWPEGKHAAIALPDERKGERVVLVTTADGDRAALAAYARKAGAQELALPAAVVTTDDIPVLGTGKTDYDGVKRIAEDAAGVGRAA